MATHGIAAQFRFFKDISNEWRTKNCHDNDEQSSRSELLYFWIIKILCTTVGETAADNLNANLNLGLTGTSLVMTVLLLLVLFFQFKVTKYVPTIYWIAVVLLSIVGTLITDNLTDNFDISLVTTTIIFSVALVAIFSIWYLVEKTLSIHSIFTTRREGFYWLAILFTFALGTAAGDLLAEKLNLGYLLSLCIFAALIATVTFAHYSLKIIYKAGANRLTSNAVLTFWIAYILTRPLGASVGDYLSQARDNGGLGLGTTETSILFFALIAILIVYLTATHKDQIKAARQ